MSLRRKIPAILLLCAVIISCVPVNAGASGCFTTAWGTAPVDASYKLESTELSVSGASTTVRIRFVCGLSGEKIRLRFSNEFGDFPITLNSVVVARASGKGDGIDTKTSCALTFGGSKSITLEPGKTHASDALEMQITSGEELCVSYYMKSYRGLTTVGLMGAQAYLSLGDKTGAESTGGLPIFLENSISVVPLLTGADVYSENGFAIVVIGDSTVSNKIPALLGEKIRAAGYDNVSVIGMGIQGNRVLSDFEKPSIGAIYGKAMLSRLDSDALNLPGVRYVVLKQGGNDIIQPYLKSLEGLAEKTSAAQVIQGYEQFISRTASKGIKPLILPMTNWKGYTRDILGTGKVDLVWSREAQDETDTLMRWINSYNEKTGANLDFSGINDPADSEKLKAEYTKDGIHFTDAGQRFIVDKIPLSLFGLSEKNVKEPEGKEPENQTGRNEEKENLFSGEKANGNGNGSDAEKAYENPATGAISGGAAMLLLAASLCTAIAGKKKRKDK